jgi:hypothetical protein
LEGFPRNASEFVIQEKEFEAATTNKIKMLPRVVISESLLRGLGEVQIPFALLVPGFGVNGAFKRGRRLPMTVVRAAH